MLFCFLSALFWVSGALAIHRCLPTWTFVLYSLISLGSFFAWVVVRGGSLRSGEEQE